MGDIKENVPGRYCVDERCIGCFICSEIAPRNFRTDPEHGYDYVYRQPQGQEERRMCAEAMEVCPVNAISDGRGRCL